MNDIKVGLHNEFDIVVTDSKTGKVKQRGKAFNIILNSFWTRFLSANNSVCLSYIHFGSGSATPAATDTALTTFIAGIAATAVSTDTSTFFTDGIVKIKKTIRLEAGAYTGATISEVGFASSISSNLNTKSLIKDANGNPLSITIGALDVVDIYGTFYSRTPLALNSGDVAFNSPFPMSICGGIPGGSSQWGWYNADVGIYNVANDGPDLINYSPTASYDVTNKKVTFTFSNVAAASGNGVGGLRALCYSSLCAKVPCTGFTQPVITKEVIATGDGSKKDFTCTFSRILNNGTAKLYVNDVEVSATFDYGVPKITSTDTLKLFNLMKYVSANRSFGTTPVILENPYYASFGLLASRSPKNFLIECSNDLSTWVTIGEGTAVSIPTAYKNYRYWRVTQTGSSSGFYGFSFTPSFATYCPVHAAEAPASGTTVALTYQPDCIAKDANHIINNVSIAITFNEYTP